MLGLAVSYLISQFGASAGQRCSEHNFFGLLPWYHYLHTEYYDDPASPEHNLVCRVDFNPLPSSGHSDILPILIVVIDDLLRIAGLVAIGFIIWGGVTYITSQGNPEQTQKAQKTIQNALLGLAFCVLSIALVSFLGAALSA
jgi:hypothetical protein